MVREVGRCLFLAGAFFVAVLAGLGSLAAEPGEQIEAYRRFAIENPGNAAAGRKLYASEKKLACENCHRITGAEKSGPNLDGIADKYSRRELIEHILRPSAAIKPGYEQATLILRDGRTVVGRVNRATKTMLRLIDAEGKSIDVSRADIEEMQASAASMMPDNLAFLVSQQQFADLVAYLETLHHAVITGFRGPGQPIEVTRIVRPVRFRATHPAEMKFANPVWCGALPGVPGQLIVVEQQEAKVWRLERTAGGMRRHQFLDLGGQVKIGVNWGLLCLAFHPQFASNRRYFLKYQVDEQATVKTTVVERRASEDLLRDSGAALRRLYEVQQPAFNHIGGGMAFGPDGMLYIGFGDGGSQRDPDGHGQNPRTAHGSMLRIDVDRPADGRPYSIPPDNPFLAAHKSDPAILPETWAIGLREPWRFSFDAKTGDLWVGDVGQDKFEEVCRIRAGENHGWNVYEGYEPFSDEYRREGAKFSFPVFAYPHSFGVSVTGGYVYRGKRAPSFEGVYIFGDYETRRVWGLKAENGRLATVRELGASPEHLASFGVDENGEIYVVGYEGTIYQLDSSESTFE